MTEDIQARISEIKTKFDTIYNKLQDERTQNVQLQDAIAQLNNELNLSKAKLQQRDKDLHRLNFQLSQMNEEIKKNQEDLKNSKNEQIDGLVKEIDFCISKLKETNV